MSVIIGRALPERPRRSEAGVHRRVICTAMRTSWGSTGTERTSKCAKIVGEVMGNFHPHGDSADLRRARPPRAGLQHALPAGRRSGELRLGRRRPCRSDALHGSFGSLGGCARATSWPTSTSETVDFVPNYDETHRGAVRVLPNAKFPNLLVNGAAGIAVGMATNIPPHNLREIIRRHRSNLIEDRDDTPSSKHWWEMVNLIPGPDFPTGGFIVRQDGRHSWKLTCNGRGSLRDAGARRRSRIPASKDERVSHRCDRNPVPGQQGEADRDEPPIWFSDKKIEGNLRSSATRATAKACGLSSI